MALLHDGEEGRLHEEGGHVRSAAATCRAGTDFSHRGNEGFRRTVTETRSYKKPKRVWQCIPQASK